MEIFYNDPWDKFILFNKPEPTHSQHMTLIIRFQCMWTVFSLFVFSGYICELYSGEELCFTEIIWMQFTLRAAWLWALSRCRAVADWMTLPVLRVGQTQYSNSKRTLLYGTCTQQLIEREKHIFKPLKNIYLLRIIHVVILQEKYYLYMKK